MRASLNQLDQICAQILSRLPDGGIILLRGDLASGKTTLVKAFVKMIGIAEEGSSPTYSVQQVYGDRVYHYDIYNEGVEKFLASGLLEELEKEGYHFIEWGDERLAKILSAYGMGYLTISIEPDKEAREYQFEAA